MKWIAIALSGLLGLVALAVVLLALLGLRSGAGKVSGAVEIGSPPAEVWPWIVDSERLTEWVGWLTEVHELTPGVEGVGARRRWVMIDPTMNNRRVEIEGEVVRYEPGRASVMHLDSPGMFTGSGSYVLVDLGDGRTRVEYESEFRMSTRVARLFEPLVTPQARKKALDDLERLKERIEAASAAAATDPEGTP